MAGESFWSKKMERRLAGESFWSKKVETICGKKSAKGETEKMFVEKKPETVGTAE